MDFDIVEKGVSVTIKDKAGQSFTSLYVGAGCASLAGPVPDDRGRCLAASPYSLRNLCRVPAVRLFGCVFCG